MSVNLTIKKIGANGAEFSVNIDLTATVEELKEKVSPQVGFPQSHIRLVCAGQVWKDGSTIASYNPSEGAIVHCLNNPPKDSPATTQALAPANPLSQMMGGLGGGLVPSGGGGDPFSSMMAQTQQQMMQNPEMMQQLMNSPMVQQMMSNPDVLRTMVRMNPQLNELMEQRPEIARMLEDPELLQQSMRLMANPSLMREMTRNADLAMGQLDAMPGGHNALVRAHEDFADPLFQAMTGGSGASNAVVVDYSQDTTGNPNNAALPNPWGAPAPAAPTPVVPTVPATPPAASPFAGLGASPFGAFGGAANAGVGGAPAANPMANMMQQMMGNPAQMQAMMNLTQQLMNPTAAPATTDATATPGATLPLATGAPAVNPLAALLGGAPAGGYGGFQPTAPAANPLAAAMQQMMSNPAQMQAMMNMSQQMFNPGTAGLGGLGGLGAGGLLGAGAADQTASPELQRIRFANQLSQLAAMGFTNEAACLRALAQHGGRVDAAIDALLASGDGN